MSVQNDRGAGRRCIRRQAGGGKGLVPSTGSAHGRCTTYGDNPSWAGRDALGPQLGKHARVEETEDVAERLAAAVEAALPGWVERSVRQRVTQFGGVADPEVMAQAAGAGQRAAAEVGPELRRLVAADVDQQWTNPLSLLRQAVRYPTAVLRDAGVPPIVRDAYDERHFPDDDYGLTPLAFADVDPSLHDVGLAWGATKAMAHLSRHRRPGEPGDGEAP